MASLPGSTGNPGRPGNPGEAPWPDYDELNIEEVIVRVRNTSPDESFLARIVAYERANKNRKGVIDALVNWNS